MKVYLVWDGTPDLLWEEQSADIIAANSLREAIALWVMKVAHDPDNTAPRGRKLTWQRTDKPEPTLPAEPCLWEPPGWRGYGVHSTDDPVCIDCDEPTDPDEFDYDTEQCSFCANGG